MEIARSKLWLRCWFVVTLATISWHPGNLLVADELKRVTGSIDLQFRLDESTTNAKHPVTDPSFVVNPKSGAIANIVVWLDLSVDSSIRQPETQKPSVKRRLKVVGKSWEPRVTVAMRGDTVTFEQALDKKPHTSGDILCPLPAFAIGTLPEFKLTETRKFPHRFSCVETGHYDEIGYLLILGHQWAAVSNSQGEVSIKDLPVGTRSFRIWHERRGWMNTIEIEGAKKQLDHGVLQVDVKPAANDAIVIRIPETTFEPRPLTPRPNDKSDPAKP